MYVKEALKIISEMQHVIMFFVVGIQATSHTEHKRYVARILSKMMHNADQQGCNSSNISCQDHKRKSQVTLTVFHPNNLGTKPN